MALSLSSTPLLSLAALGLAVMASCSGSTSEPQGEDSQPVIAASCQPALLLLNDLLWLRDNSGELGHGWTLITLSDFERAERVKRGDRPIETIDDVPLERERALLCPIGEDPSHWPPTREALARARSAELLISISDDFEPWIANANLAPSRHLKLLDGTAEALPGIATVTHRHGNGPAHSHAGRSPFAWMDPLRCAEITAWLNEELSARYADFGGLERSRQLAEAYRNAHERALGTFERCEGIRLLGPSTGECAYWEQRYGVRIDPFDLPGGEGPLSTEDLIAIRGRLDPTRPNLAFVRGDVSSAVRAQLAEKLELEVIALNNGLGERVPRTPWANELAAHFNALDAALEALGR
jgi:ABC-type Zn uptake system ZnuABC Zn-binding protein ZnuA